MGYIHFRFQVRESNFTRTISNPDFVVKKNRQMKHAKALAKTQSVELTIYTDLSPTCYFVKGRGFYFSTNICLFQKPNLIEQKDLESNSLQLWSLCSVSILPRTLEITKRRTFKATSNSPCLTNRSSRSRSRRRPGQAWRT